MSADYFLEIEAHFALRRGTPFVLNAKDWALMKSWADDGIPLPVVIEAIDTVFDNAAARNKTVSSLSYCRHAVRDLWKERRELHVGAHDQAPEENVEPLLAALADDLAASTAPAEVVADFAASIRALASERSVPRVEEKLIELEESLIGRVLDAIAPAELESIRADVARALGTAKLDEKTRARTEEANRRRIVRDRFGLPRLTLFR